MLLPGARPSAAGRAAWRVSSAHRGSQRARGGHDAGRACRRRALVAQARCALQRVVGRDGRPPGRCRRVCARCARCARRGGRQARQQRKRRAARGARRTLDLVPKPCHLFLLDGVLGVGQVRCRCRRHSGARPPDASTTASPPSSHAPHENQRRPAPPSPQQCCLLHHALAMRCSPGAHAATAPSPLPHAPPPGGSASSTGWRCRA